LIEEIAQGGMGVVYKARHTTVDRIVALKTFRPDIAARPQDAQRFDREMRAAARLSHPHIVPVYEVGQHQGQPYSAMAYLPAGSLAGWQQSLLDEPRPDLPLKCLQGLLARGESVTLIGDTGGPRWARWVFGEGGIGSPP
jgi:serine/threonine protein kinase